MALFDHRVFGVDGEWWAAQVHSASGGGWGEAPPAISRERVYFSSLTDLERHTVTASIPPGSLNRLSHDAIVRRLRAGRDFGHHFKMSAYNAPSVEELGPPACTDREGLRWVIRPSRVVRVDADRSTAIVEAAEFVCLDDSALRRDVPLTGLNFNEFKSGASADQLQPIIEQIKSTFRDYAPDKYDDY